MRKVLIERFDSSDEGTFGRCFIDGEFFSFSLELPWRDNIPNFSRIPAGSYKCAHTFSPNFRKHLYEVFGVPNRTVIRIHPANFAGDRELGFRTQLHGCIALCEKIGELDKQRAALSSMPAVRRFESELEFQPFLLEVKDD